MQSMDKFKNAPYCVSWLDTTQKGNHLGRGILEVAHHAHEGIFVDYQPSQKTMSFYAPSWTLNAKIVKIFNYFYYHRATANKHSFEAYEQFQYPLDNIKNWNKLYGRQGFYQFQCVVPFDNAEHVLENILSRSNRAGFASPLAVLKRLGQQNQGYLSFPMAGYTLAIDIPAKQGAIALMKTLEDLICEANGRIYPAKDALMTAESFAKMYPRKDAFLTILKQINAKPVSQAAHRYGLCYE
jgi:decaprenylphospho-beta-D-ribofuranose 2-oxidase